MRSSNRQWRGGGRPLRRVPKSDLEAIYSRLPVPLQHVACSFVGWRTSRTRYAGEFRQILAEAEGRTYWSAEEIVSYRDRRLARFVSEAASAVPEYRERFRAARLRASDVRTIADLSSLPVLTKAEVQDYSTQVLRSPGGRVRMVHTSGTTGGGLRFPVTLRAAQEQWAMWWRYRGWHGIGYGTWCALFAGRSVVPRERTDPPFWRMNLPGRQLVFSGYHMSAQNLPSYCGELRRRRPPWLHGYPSFLTLLAAHVLETGFDLGYQVRWVTIGAESLLPHQAAMIERAFGVKPIQHYGLAEAVANVSECELGSLHVDEDFAAVEFLPLEQTGLYRIVGTNLSNPAMPLIRYDSQDLAELVGDASCRCGRPGRVVESINGRQDDYVMARSGTLIGSMDLIFKDMVNIREGQIHQARRGEMTIRVVPGPDYAPDDEQALRRETARRVGDDMIVKIDYVSALPRSRVGKLRCIVSEVAGASIEAPPHPGAESSARVTRV
jgi:phenylacetate-CoA ligase